MTTSGLTKDIEAPPAHAFPALSKAAAHGLPTLADEGYVGAGARIRVVPVGQSEQATHTVTRTPTA